MSTAPLLELRDLQKRFPLRRGAFSRISGHVRAVEGVSFTIGGGETLGLVGESGCGKSTVGKTLLKLLEPTDGRILVEGTDITHFNRRRMMPIRRELQIVFQDPYSSINPRMTAGAYVGEPLVIHGLVRGSGDRRRRVAELFERVGLRPDQMDRYPHEFSGGQRQRLAIARMILSDPKVVILDEATSSLDTETEARLHEAMHAFLQDRTTLIIAHRLSAVRQADRVLVFDAGQIIDEGRHDELISRDGLYRDLYAH